MSAKFYLKVLKNGVLASFLIFFFVFPGLLFPYITSKQLCFNILVEFLLIFWLLLIIKYPAYRPRRSYITWGLILYFLAILLSAVAGRDFNLSFWSNAERMLGFFHLFHFLLFYFIIITAFRKAKDWEHLFSVSVLVGALVSIFGIIKAYPASTIGNAAYVAGLMIFDIFFALWLLIKSKKWWTRILYGSALIFLFIGLVRADISGAFAGLVLGLLAFGYILATRSENKKMKYWTISLVAFFILVLSLLFTFRNQPALDNSRLGKMLRDFSSDNVTLNTRMLSWVSAYLDFKHHPILGTGYGNYAATFDRYFNPSFFEYGRNETYFDRAHNNLIEIASTTGLVGLLSYLSIFVALFYYLFGANKEKRFKTWETALFAGLIIAYFVQNLAVFDSLVTYISLFMVLGFVYYLSQKKEEEKEEKALNKNQELILALFLTLIFTSAIFAFNVRGFKMFKGTIKGYSYVSAGYLEEGVKYYQEAFAKETGYNRDSRSTLITLMTSAQGSLEALNPKTRDELLAYTAELARKNLDYNPNDSLMALQAARFFNMAAKFYYHDIEKFNEYAGDALYYIDSAVLASPGRIPLYSTKADVHLTRGEVEEAKNTLKTAINLKEDFPDGYCFISNIYFYEKSFPEAYDNFYACSKYGGMSFIRYTEMATSSLKYFEDKGESDKGEEIRKIWQIE